MSDSNYPIAIEEDIDFQYYLLLLKRHWKLLLTVAVIAGSLSAIYAFKQPDIFSATSQIIIQMEREPESYAEFRGRPEGGGGAKENYYKTQIVIIESPTFLEEAVRGHNLVKPLFESSGQIVPEDLSDQSVIDRAVGMISRGLNVYQIKETRILNISYKSPYRVLCWEIANSVAKAYVRRNLEESLYAPKELLEFFPEEAGDVDMQTAFGKLKNISRDDLAQTLPSVVKDPLIRQLKSKAAAKDSELQTLYKTYKGKHPKILELKGELQFIEDRIKIEAENIIQNLKTSLASKLLVSPVRILKEAEVPRRPIGPDRTKTIIMAILGALIGTIGIVYLLDYLDDSLKTQEDVEKFVQLPFLGHVPLIKGKETDPHKTAFFVHYDPLSQVSEAYRFIKVAINFSGPPGSLKCILMTSTVPAEGKSTTTANLAASFLRDTEKVLLVDSDLRHPTVHLLVGVKNTRGLTNYLVSNETIDSVVQKTSIPNLDVITTGPLSPNPTELFSSYRMTEFIKDAKEKYDRILIDSPPIIGLADSLVIGNKCDGTILLVQAKRVSRNMVKKAKQRLLETGIKVLGVILNRVDFEKDEASYRYYAYSYRYYGKHRKQKAEEDAAKGDSLDDGAPKEGNSA